MALLKGIIHPLYINPSTSDGQANWNTVAQAARGLARNQTYYAIVAITPLGEAPQADEYDDSLQAYDTAFANTEPDTLVYIGYVHLHSTVNGVFLRRALDDVKKDIDMYAKKAPTIAGIFFDETDSQWAGADKAGEPPIKDYYAILFDYVSANFPEGVLITNSGTSAANEVVAAAKTSTAAGMSVILVTFESPYDNASVGDWGADWTGNHGCLPLNGTAATWQDHLQTNDPTSKGAIVHDCSTSVDTIKAVNLANARGCEYIFVTDGKNSVTLTDANGKVTTTPDTTFSIVPTYLTDMVATVKTCS